MPTGETNANQPAELTPIVVDCLPNGEIEGQEMAQLGTVTVRYELASIRAARALVRAKRIVGRLASDQPWNEDAKEAKRLLRRAIRGLVPKAEKE